MGDQFMVRRPGLEVACFDDGHGRGAEVRVTVSTDGGTQVVIVRVANKAGAIDLMSNAAAALQTLRDLVLHG